MTTAQYVWLWLVWLFGRGKHPNNLTVEETKYLVMSEKELRRREDYNDDGRIVKDVKRQHFTMVIRSIDGKETFELKQVLDGTAHHSNWDDSITVIEPDVYSWFNASSRAAVKVTIDGKIVAINKNRVLEIKDVKMVEHKLDITEKIERAREKFDECEIEPFW